MLLEIKHTKEIYCPKWLSNVVLAPKGPTWRMCVDYIDLNEVFPMEQFPPAQHKPIGGRDSRLRVDELHGHLPRILPDIHA